MDFETLVKTRQSCRDFNGEKVTKEEVGLMMIHVDKEWKKKYKKKKDKAAKEVSHE